MSASLRYFITCICFFLSGLAALIYQIAWTRQFALVFGTSELAVATVLAAYMFGLALGARGIEWYLPRVQRSVWWYARLEVGIALAALVWVPLCLWVSEHLLVSWMGGQAAPPNSELSGATLFYLIAAFITLCVPTALMGATLPLLVRDGVHTQAQVGRRVGGLYVCNTAGAVAGALLAALYLLSAFGLRGSIWIAAVFNACAGGLALSLQRATTSQSSEPIHTEDNDPNGQDEDLPQALWILPLMLISGAVSFLHEVLWTRMLSHVMGSSIIAFGVMVASFLLGIALGGGIGALLAKTVQRALRSWIVVQLLSALAAIVAWWVLLHYAPDKASLSIKVAFGLAVLLPLSTAIGATYPLAVRMLARDADGAALASARVYVWNTVGAIGGSLLGGFWLIPALRYEGSVHLAVMISVVLAVIAVSVWLRKHAGWLWPVVTGAVLMGVLFQPSVPERLLKLSPVRTASGELLRYSVGRSADVVVLDEETVLDLRTNGLPEAGIDKLGVVPSLNLEAWMSPLAVLARPNTQSMLIVGLGGGNAVQAVPPSVKQVDVIELEPEVVAANRALSAVRARDSLIDSRVNVIVNDARGALLLTDKKYDAVVSQPSHPWTAGASHLYTQEFMQQVHEHLNPGGVFVQWMSADFIDEALLRSLLATITSVFPEVRVYRTSPNTLLFMGSDQPIEPERQWQRTRNLLLTSERHYSRLGLNAFEDVLAALVLDTNGAKSLCVGQPLITDNDNRLATSGVYDFKRTLSPSEVGRLLAPYDPLTHADSFVYRELAPNLSFAYLAKHLSVWLSGDSSIAQRLQGMSEALGDSEQGAELRWMVMQQNKQFTQAQQALSSALQRWSNNQLFNYAEVEPYLGGTEAAVPTQVTAAAGRLQGGAALTVYAMQLAGAQKWSELAALDAQLEQIEWTAPWYGQAAQLRAEWRARVSNKALRPRYGAEAIAIADRILMTQADGFWYALRALNAVDADQPRVMLESIAAFVQMVVERGQTLTGSERELVKLRMTQLLPLLESLRGIQGLNNERWRQVESRMRQAQQVLS